MCMPAQPERIDAEQIESKRLVLVPLPVAMARAIAGGDLSVVSHAEDWPHADTLEAVRMAAQTTSPGRCGS